MSIPKHIFRKYDIRGLSSLYDPEPIKNDTFFQASQSEAKNQDVLHTSKTYPVEIDASFVRGLAKVLAAYFQERGHYRVLLGYDTRKYSFAYHDILCKELNKYGCDVVTLGMIPTPCLYFAAHFLQIFAGIMITASHNHAEYNGFKIWEGRRTLCCEEIQDIYERMCNLYEKKEAELTRFKFGRALTDKRLAELSTILNKPMTRAKFRRLILAMHPYYITRIRAHLHFIRKKKHIGGLTSEFKIKLPYMDALCTQIISAFPCAFLPMTRDSYNGNSNMEKEELQDFLNRRTPIFINPRVPDNGLRRRVGDGNIVKREQESSENDYIVLNTGVSHKIDDIQQTKSQEMSFFQTEFFNTELQKLRRDGEWEKHVQRTLNATPLLSQGDILKRKLNIVVDGGNGVAGELFCQLLKEMTFKTTFSFNIIPLYCTPMVDFPNHSPDPTVKENCKDLCEAVLKNKADYGIAFDGDGDRMVLVDRNARIIESDVLLSILARDVLLRIPGARILADVKCSQKFFKEVELLGGICIVAPTGHSVMKANMLAQEAHLGGEFSGHFFHAQDFSRRKIRDVELLPFRNAFFHSPFILHRESPPVQIDWFGTDDGLLSALRVLAVLHERGWDLTQFPLWGESFASPEISFHCPEDKKALFMNFAIEYFTKKYGAVGVEQCVHDDPESPTSKVANITYKAYDACPNTPTDVLCDETAKCVAQPKITTIDGLRVDFEDSWFLVRPSHTTNSLILRFEAKTEAEALNLGQEVEDVLHMILKKV